MVCYYEIANGNRPDELRYGIRSFRTLKEAKMKEWRGVIAEAVLTVVFAILAVIWWPRSSGAGITCLVAAGYLLIMLVAAVITILNYKISLAFGRPA